MEQDDVIVVNFCVFEEEDGEYFTKNQIQEYSTSLSEKFGELYLVGNINPRKGTLTSRIDVDSVTVVPFIDFRSNFLISLLVGMARILRASFASSYAIVNVPSIGYAPAIIPISFLTGHLSVYVAMDPHDVVNRPQSKLRRRIPAELKHWINIAHTTLALKLSDSILVRGDKTRYESYGNVHESKPIISISEHEDDTRTEDEFIFLYIGGLYERKGLDVLLKAFAQVATEYEDVQLRIVGNGDQREALKQLAESLNVEKQIVFKGYIDDSTELTKMYHQSDVLVHPARRGEGFPRVIDEAHLYNLPVVATDLSHFSDSLTDGENVLLASPGSVSSLDNELKRIIQNPEIREELAKNGQARVADLSHESAVDQHAAIMKREYSS